MRHACIDIGSNTTRLLVADDAGRGLSIVCEERVFTKIGASLTAAGTIPEAKRAEMARVVGDQLARARELGAREIHGVATAAVRRAANGAVLVAELRALAGLEVRVLSAAEEARLAFRGASAMLGDDDVSGTLGVLDVGGGSSEIVVGRAAGEVDWWASLPLGSGSLAGAHLHGDPPTSDELAAARADVEAAGEQLRLGPPPARTIAVGGSATSLRRLAGARLDPAACHRALSLLCAAPAADIAQRHAIDVERARLLPAGLMLLEGLAARLGGTVEVGRGGIREGVLLEALAR